MSLYIPVIDQQRIGISKEALSFTINFFLMNPPIDDIKINIRFKDLESGIQLGAITKSAEVVEGAGAYPQRLYSVLIDDSNLINILKVKDSCQVQIQYQKSLSEFSGWSSASIINFIGIPECKLYDARSFYNKDVYILGELVFPIIENDSLDWYQIFLFYNSALIEKSNRITPLARNEIKYKMILPIKADNSKYTATVIYGTRKGYLSQAENIPLTFEEGVTQENDLLQLSNCKAILNGEFINITHGIEGTVEQVKEATLYLERASSNDYYNSWETIGSRSFIFETDADYITASNALFWSDKFLSPGVGYKYRVKAKYFSNTDLVTYISQSNETNHIFYFAEDILLSTADKTLKIRYNPKISNFKYNITDTVTSTLGSEYPFIRRNGNAKYRSFSLGGLIYSENMAEENFFNKYKELGLNYSDPIIMEGIRERMFRDLLINFLQAGNIKLFRSLTEGSMLIKLSNISISPEDKLGRRIWSFTADATEVAEYSVENLEKYGFAPIGFDQNTEQLQFGDFVIYVTNYDEAAKAITVKENYVDTDNKTLNVAIAMR